jgi:hypothetical protein
VLKLIFEVVNFLFFAQDVVRGFVDKLLGSFLFWGGIQLGGSVEVGGKFNFLGFVDFGAVRGLLLELGWDLFQVLIKIRGLDLHGNDKLK